MTTLTATDAVAAWGALEQSEAPIQPTHYRHYRPLVEAADEFIREAQDQNRIYTGTPEFDAQMRGIGSGHLCIVTGYSHSGKTLWLTSVLRHNKHKRILFFIPDEPATLVLSKLASIESGVGAKDLEERVANGDQEAIELLRNTALVDFPNLIVMDKPLDAFVLNQGFDEACEVWGGPPDLVIIDYVDLLTAGETVQAKFDAIKGFGSRKKLPIIALHQTSRSAGADGRKMTISSGNYGGEQHATFMIGVRRKKSSIEAEIEELRPRVAKGSEQAIERMTELEYDLAIAQFTVTINLVKNKRPGGGLVDDMEMEIDTATGQLYPLRDGDMPTQYLRMKEAQRHIMERQAPTTPTPPATGWSQTEAFPGEESF